MAKGGVKKQPKAAFNPSLAKQPTISRWPTRDQSQVRIAWRFADIDLDGEWGWRSVDIAQVAWLRQWLGQMEKLTWEEAYGPKTGAKLCKLDNAPAKTIARLEELQRDDVDGLVEFHPQGRPRVWGVRIGNVCHLLWWDPDHTVWPAKKKHT